ncbi:MAG: pyruvate carboxylase [Paracoccaceae bacterium]|nr:pyruvate carboxylase [Paracoccaceae bacterium]
MQKFKKILIANRGEIAIRVMRAANEMGKSTVAIFAEEDKLSLHRFKADEAYKIGQGMGPVAAYLNIQEIIQVAKMADADAIHPGYGLLSEKPEFAEACIEAGLAFIGPSPKTMRQLGNKATARKMAVKAGVPVIPASDILPESTDKLEKMAKDVGLPLMLKASWGGGGRGMRLIKSFKDLKKNVLEGKREAKNAFGNSESFLEKYIENARHVEVQILGDKDGNIYHLWERDCSIQRRNQKVIERAPAPYLTKPQRNEVCKMAGKICQMVGYQCAGTVEFLMDVSNGNFFFIEVNPRIQVEHTVTEEVTGIDIVRAQIMLAEGSSIKEATGKNNQEEIQCHGHALQCRITTEDPLNNFIPDYGRITAYRGATGMGIRLDGGTAYSGAIITRFYDSLLEKVTAWAPTAEDAIARMDRALREFRIRGVSTNISFVENLLKNEIFLNNSYTTKFIDSTPQLFKFSERQDRATKLLTYIASISIEGHPETKNKKRPDSNTFSFRNTKKTRKENSSKNLKKILDKKGADAVASWTLNQRQLLITDTTMRDGHQSLLATRMRSIDMLKVADRYDGNLAELFSVECWGGATFDVAYRFLQECPWQRLRDLRNKMPNTLLQMLLRGSNGVGYTNYPDNYVKYFVTLAAQSGIDLFRVFDSLNWVENMRLSMDAVLETGKILEASICYTGDILDPTRSKYDLKYYVKMAKELQKAGTHLLGLKDMAGLLKPSAAKLLIKTLKDETGLPVHLHTHDTSGAGIATLLAASEAGVDVVDCAMDAFSGSTSQPCLGSILETLQNTERASSVRIDEVRDISNYWLTVRKQYSAFDQGVTFPASEVYLHEMPGGQFTNLLSQAKSLGLTNKWPEIAKTYSDVNQLFGDIVKVTPSSKVVGDMALLMISQGLTKEQVQDPKIEVAFPESVLDMLRGNLGQPPGGFPKSIVKKALGKGEIFTSRPGSRIKQESLDKIRDKACSDLSLSEIDEEDFCSYLMYPKIFAEYLKHHSIYGPVRTLPSDIYFYGMKNGEELSVEIDPGKTLEIRLQAISEINEEGEIKAFFELNGQPRIIRITDQGIMKNKVKEKPKAELKNPKHISAPMPGAITLVAVKEGQPIKKGDVLLTIEAMKMETALNAEREGKIRKIYVKTGTQIDAKDLLIELE